MTSSAPNLRSLLPLERSEGLEASPTYADYCREERNFSAILYAQLLRPEGLQAFLGQIEGIGPIEHPERAEVFFEYAHARDLWHSFGTQGGGSRDERNLAYRRAILRLIGAPEGFMEQGQGVQAFNQYFMDKRGSKDAIQMPNQWDQRLFGHWARDALNSGWYTERDEALRFAERICCLKWAFNAKADIVIHLPDGRAVCVEIKVASGESKYSASHDDDGAPAKYSLSQTKLQRYVLETLLGYQAHFVFLTPESGRSLDVAGPTPPPPAIAELDGTKVQTLGWAEVLQVLHADTSKPDQLLFVRRMLNSKYLLPKKRRGT